MCGIAFLFNPEFCEATRKEKVLNALGALIHRGPDDYGLLVDSLTGIGHRRLAILDIEGSNQPMVDPGHRYVLAYNGEVYNFSALRDNLRDYWSFRTNGDTEVVLAGLVVHGVPFLSRMEGMWALALWDRGSNALLLARDRMGKKPLYYQITKKGFACSSELTALSHLVEQSWREDLNSTADYFRYGFYLPGTTAYENVREVLPGHYLSWQPDSGAEQTQYWSLPVNTDRKTRSDNCAELYSAFSEAVRCRMLADVEVGAFLSGGIDSSLIVSLLYKDFGIKPKTFTIGFEDKSFDERNFAREVSARCNTEHHEEVLAGWDRELLENLIIDHVGQPFADPSILPTALVSKLASRSVKVALSGDGGDEIFSGYQRYQARILLRWYTRLPALLRKNIERIIKIIPEPMSHHSHSLLKKAHLFMETINRQHMENPYVAPTLWAMDDFAKLVPDLKSYGHKAPGLPEECSPDDVKLMMYSDALVYLPQDILLKVDRAAMAYSLEVRAPFLDRKVVELAFSFSSSQHRYTYSGKRMLRQCFGELLPKSVWNRRKQGFGVPVHKWFQGSLGSDLIDLLSQTNSPLNKSMVEILLNHHRSSHKDNSNRLWCIYIYLLWQQKKLSRC